ncbi:MAG: GNAT family N-acetyltransferase [Pseudonocardiaceae bacterium]
MLVRAVLARASEIGAHRVVLCTAAEMHVAHRLYARLGFARLPHLDWCPVPGYTLLAFGKTAGAPQPGFDIDLPELRNDQVSDW